MNNIIGKLFFCIVFIIGNSCAQSGWFEQNSGTYLGLRDVYFYDLNLGWAVGNEDLVLKTTSGGATWASQQIGVYSLSPLNSVFFFPDFAL